MITESIKYIGVNDHEIDLFEGQYPVPNGMAYNSYAVMDERIAVMDSVEVRFAQEWLNKLETVLEGRKPDYLIVQHMEPDHSGSIRTFMETYPEAKIVASARAFTMLKNFFGLEYEARKVVAADGVTLCLGQRTLHFYTAAMIHWPEVIMTYDDKDKILFSADAFGKFGALDVEDEWTCEARRYYIGIVGKYGGPVQNLLKKVAGLDIQKICSLHGPVLHENLDYYFNLYHIWSSYAVEEEGIVIAYTTVYGNTKKAVEQLAELLRARGQKVVVNDLARCDMYEAVEDAFRYSKLVLATTTYDGGIFPYMLEFINHLTKRGYTNRTVGFIENGSWAPVAARQMREQLEKAQKNLTYLEPAVRLVSALNEVSAAQLVELAEALCREPGEEVEQPEAKTGSKKFVCKVCGYVYEGEELPADYVCPLCKQGTEAFEEQK